MSPEKEISKVSKVHSGVKCYAHYIARDCTNYYELILWFAGLFTVHHCLKPFMSLLWIII